MPRLAHLGHFSSLDPELTLPARLMEAKAPSDENASTPGHCHPVASGERQARPPFTQEQQVRALAIQRYRQDMSRSNSRKTPTKFQVELHKAGFALGRPKSARPFAGEGAERNPIRTQQQQPASDVSRIRGIHDPVLECDTRGNSEDDNRTAVSLKYKKLEIGIDSPGASRQDGLLDGRTPSTRDCTPIMWQQCGGRRPLDVATPCSVTTPGDASTLNSPDDDCSSWRWLDGQRQPCLRNFVPPVHELRRPGTSLAAYGGALPLSARRNLSSAPRCRYSQIEAFYTKPPKLEILYNAGLPKYNLDTIRRWYRRIDRDSTGVVSREQLIAALNEEEALFDMFCAPELHQVRDQKLSDVERELARAVSDADNAFEASEDEKVAIRDRIRGSIGDTSQLKWSPGAPLRTISTTLRAIILRRCLTILGNVASDIAKRRASPSEKTGDEQPPVAKGSNFASPFDPSPELSPSVTGTWYETHLKLQKRLLDYEIAVEYYRRHDMVMGFTEDWLRNDVQVCATLSEAENVHERFRLKGSGITNERSVAQRPRSAPRTR